MERSGEHDTDDECKKIQRLQKLSNKCTFAPSSGVSAGGWAGNPFFTLTMVNSFTSLPYSLSTLTK